MRTLMWVAVLATACSFDPGGFTGSSGDGGTPAPDARPGAIDGGGSSGADARPPGAIDAAPVEDIDASPACAAPAAGNVGSPCSSDSACSGGAGAFCLDENESWPGTGYCTHVCDSDDDCGPGARCSAAIGDTGSRVCFATCCGGGGCGRGGMACTDAFATTPVGFDACLPANNSAGDGNACDTFGDCAPGSVCSDNPFEAPGGYCVTLGCTLGDDSTCAPGGDGVCIDVDPFDAEPAFCADRCTSNGNCRTGEGYECVPVGIGVSVCAASHADPGAACSNDGDCGPDPWECLRGDEFPGGYCSAEDCSGGDDSCPEGSFCGRVGETTFCVESCDPGPVPCRFLEGYECVSFGMGFNGCIQPP